MNCAQALETEQRLGENMVPELSRTDQPHSHAEWSVLVEKLYAELRELAKNLTGDEQFNAKYSAMLELDLATFARRIWPPHATTLRKTGPSMPAT